MPSQPQSPACSSSSCHGWLQTVKAWQARKAPCAKLKDSHVSRSLGAVLEIERLPADSGVQGIGQADSKVGIYEGEDGQRGLVFLEVIDKALASGKDSRYGDFLHQRVSPPDLAVWCATL